MLCIYYSKIVLRAHRNLRLYTFKGQRCEYYFAMLYSAWLQNKYLGKLMSFCYILHKCASILWKANLKNILETISPNLLPKKVSDSYTITLTLNDVLYAALPCLFAAYSTRSTLCCMRRVLYAALQCSLIWQCEHYFFATFNFLHIAKRLFTFIGNLCDMEFWEHLEIFLHLNELAIAGQ